jgi:hypothetical protein
LGYFLARVHKVLGRWFDLSLAFKRKVDSSDVETITQFDDGIDQLWQRFAAGIGCAVVREHGYLNWRLIKHPEMKYTNRIVRGSDGQIRAFLSHVWVEKHGGRIGYIMEALAAPGTGAELQKLFALAENEFIDNRVDAVLAWCLPTSPNAPDYRRAGFFSLPEKLRPIQLHFGGRTFDGSPFPDTKAWYISYIDSDTV